MANIKIRGPWVTMLTWVSSYKSLIQQFRLSCHGNKSKWGICTTSLCLVEDYSTNIYKKFCQNTCSEIARMTNFHFSHYKSMETLSCHSNEMTWATAIKNIIFVEANYCYEHFCKVSASSPSRLLRRWFLNIFCKFILSVAMATNQIQRFGQNSYVW